MPEDTSGNVQSIQDHSEEEYTMRQEVRQEIISQRLNFAKGIDLAMLARAFAGGADLMPAQKAAYHAALDAAGVSDAMKNAAAFPAVQDKTVVTERGTQTISEDTTSNVINQAFENFSKTLNTDIQRTLQEGLASMSTVISEALGSAVATAAQAAAKAAVAEYIQQTD